MKIIFQNGMMEVSLKQLENNNNIANKELS